MSQRDAALVSLPEFTQRQRGWEREQRQRWEIVRWEVWHLYLNNPYIKQGQKPRKPSDILHLEGDPKPKAVTRKECHVGKKKQAILIDIFNRINHNG